MKKYTLLLISYLLIVTSIFAQAPQQFKYQAVLRDGSGNIIASQAKSIVIDILQGSSSGSVVFTETHNVTTTAQGIINLNIGSILTMDIDWAANTYFIKITVGGVEMGTSQLLSVPYALYSEKAGNGFSGSYNDLKDVPQNIWTKSENNIYFNSGNVSIGTDISGDKLFVDGSTVVTGYLAVGPIGDDIIMMRTSPAKLGIGTASPKSKLEIKDGDVYINNSANGIILTSPDGQCWRVTIDNTGNFIRTSVTCP